jgi:phosphonate utilization transcriptional regulator
MEHLQETALAASVETRSSVGSDFRVASVRGISCRLLTIYTATLLIASMLKKLGSTGGDTEPDRTRPARAHASAMPADHPIALLKRNSLPGLVQRELERMILAGEIGAGGKLNEAAVAERLGVSRGPVREAFRALEESGLVELVKNRGVFVRKVSLDEADEIYELRAVLDDFAGRRAAQLATRQQVKELATLVERMDRAIARSDRDAYHDANLAFHDRVIELAGNGKLLQLYRRLVNELRLFRRASLDQAGTLPVSVREHRAIVERIAAREAAATGRLLHEHALGGRDRARRSVTSVDGNVPPTARRTS